MDADRARIRRPEPRDAFHRGGLAGTVGSYDSKDLALLYREGYIIDGDEIPVSFYEVLNRDCLFRLLLTHHHILQWMNSKITNRFDGIVSQHGSAGPSLARESWLKNVKPIVTCPYLPS